MQIRLGNFQQQVLDGNVLTYQTISVKISLPRQGCICYQRKRLAHKELEIYAQKYCLKMMMLMISNLTLFLHLAEIMQLVQGQKILTQKF